MQIKLIECITAVDPADWNGLAGEGYPFLRHAFLSALETSGSVSPATGWEPKHVLVFDGGGEPVALMPLYLKHHSNGEYVFDYQWADVYERYGRGYYPKLLTAVPFTPCMGPRIAVKEGADPIHIYRAVFASIREFAEQHGLSSWHCLFPSEAEADHLAGLGLYLREGVQFQWFNNGYGTFDDFLQAMTASKRKMIKRERRKVQDAGITLHRFAGNEIGEDRWRAFYRFYQMTYLKHGMRPYLNLDFFLRCADTMADRLLLVLARKDSRYVGAALSFTGGDTLYGRYWGCLEEFDFLHFETCYYQGIDYCIERGLKRFDSGAQGEHKIARGFEPVTTQSAHWFSDPAFSEAAAQFLQREKLAVRNYKQAAASYSPFKNKIPGPD